MFAREAGAGGIDLFGTLGDFGEHRNAVVVDFEETARDVQLKVRAVLIVSEHSGFQFRDERRVAGKQLHLAIAAGHSDSIHGFRKYTPLRSYYVELKLIGHRSIESFGH